MLPRGFSRANQDMRRLTLNNGQSDAIQVGNINTKGQNKDSDENEIEATPNKSVIEKTVQHVQGELVRYKHILGSDDYA